MALATTSAQGRFLFLRPNAPLVLDSAALRAEATLVEESGCRPRLMGDGMPTLDWPDTASGPWSEAGRLSRKRDEERKKSIARWLDEDSDDEEGPSSVQQQPSQRHPMVAKVVMDRKRKELLIRSLAVPTPPSTTISSDSGRSSSSARKLKRRRNGESGKGDNDLESPSLRRHKYGKHAKGMPAERITPALDSFVTPRKKGKKSKKVLVASQARVTSHLDCPCGVKEHDDTPMVQCSLCNSLYHVRCTGSADALEPLDDDWTCSMCCDIVTGIPTPSSLSSGLSVTPIFPRSAVAASEQVRLSQGQLPVFAQPVETPNDHLDDAHVHSFSSALALAPSPRFPSESGSAARRPSGQLGGRARASRVGWHMNEPGSPLERKSISSFASHRRNLSGGGGTMFGIASGSPSSRNNRGTFGGSGAYDHVNSFGVSAADAYLRTPSPRLSSTPATQRTRQASSNFSIRSGTAALGHGGGHRREQSNSARDFDDIFSTPSRILNGSSSWGQPMTSMMRHSRQESAYSINANSFHGGGQASNGTPWGLSTPTRHLMDAGFQSDYSGGAAGGLPSLVHSSGGLDMGEFAGWHHLQMSPSSSTRAATRARQQSNNAHHDARRTSSVRRPSTPDRSSTFDAASSSPFPKTPTFVTDSYHHAHGGLVDDDDHDDEDGDNTLIISSRSVGPAHHHHLSAGRRLSSLSHGLGLSPSVGGGIGSVSPSTSHARSFGAPSKSRNASGELASLQGPVELKAARPRHPSSTTTTTTTTATTIKHLKNGQKPRARNASNDLMAGLGIGLDLNDVSDWV